MEDVTSTERRGIQKGLPSGIRTGTLQFIIQRLQKRFGRLNEATLTQICALPLEQLQALCDDLLDFEALADLTAWLQQHDSLAEEHLNLPDNGCSLDKIARYRQIIQHVFEGYARATWRNDDAQLLPVFDIANDQYLLVSLGESHKRPENIFVFYVDLRMGKLLLEGDHTEAGIRNDLIQAGIAAEDIRLMRADEDCYSEQPMILAA